MVVLEFSSPNYSFKIYIYVHKLAVLKSPTKFYAHTYMFDRLPSYPRLQSIEEMQELIMLAL